MYCFDEVNYHFNAARQIVYRRTDSLTETETTSVNPLIVKQTVIDILMEYALENMTSFYSVIRKDFGIQCNTVDCYRALYLYKCRQYDEVLHLCERILHEPDLQSDLKEFAFANVLLLPPLDSFFDGDVQSLLGFHTLFYYLSPPNDDMRNVGLTQLTSQRLHNFLATVCAFIGMNSSISLRDHYSIKCNYFLGRHFLARYLKVRCCIDCNLPLYRSIDWICCSWKVIFRLNTSFADFFYKSFALLKTKTRVLLSMTEFCFRVKGEMRR